MAAPVGGGEICLDGMRRLAGWKSKGGPALADTWNSSWLDAEGSFRVVSISSVIDSANTLLWSPSRHALETPTIFDDAAAG